MSVFERHAVELNHVYSYTLWSWKAIHPSIRPVSETVRNNHHSLLWPQKVVQHLMVIKYSVGNYGTGSFRNCYIFPNFPCKQNSAIVFILPKLCRSRMGIAHTPHAMPHGTSCKRNHRKFSFEISNMESLISAILAPCVANFRISCVGGG